MEKLSFSFQTDSDIVIRQRKEANNYTIEYNESYADKLSCCIYFSSNDLYFPNDETQFQYSVIDKDRYEWRNIQPVNAYKNIYVRDVNKQWYLNGICEKYNTPEKLLSLLKKETEGFEITTLGSSAGGYAAILYGIQLNAIRIFAFNPQFEIKSLLYRSTESINPLVFRYSSNPAMEAFYDLVPIIKTYNGLLFYYYSNKSQWDLEQMSHLKSEGADVFVKIVSFSTAHHGIPFPKVVFEKLLKCSDDILIQDSYKNHNSLVYSIQKVGILKTSLGLINQILKYFQKRKRLRLQ